MWVLVIGLVPMVIAGTSRQLRRPRRAPCLGAELSLFIAILVLVDQVGGANDCVQKEKVRQL